MRHSFEVSNGSTKRSRLWFNPLNPGGTYMCHLAKISNFQKISNMFEVFKDLKEIFSTNVRTSDIFVRDCAGIIMNKQYRKVHCNMCI